MVKVRSLYPKNIYFLKNDLFKFLINYQNIKLFSSYFQKLKNYEKYFFSASRKKYKNKCHAKTCILKYVNKKKYEMNYFKFVCGVWLYLWPFFFNIRFSAHSSSVLSDSSLTKFTSLEEKKISCPFFKK